MAIYKTFRSVTSYFLHIPKQHYTNAIFVGFVDGLGWYARQNDLKRMVAAYEDVFTFHEDELKRFEKLIIKKVKNA